MTVAPEWSSSVAGYVTPNAFGFLGVPAQLGRGITPDDARPGAPPVFVMAHKLWVDRFNLNPTILGKTFTLNGTPTTLVGIMPPRFIFYAADVWIARAMERGDPRSNRDYWVSLGEAEAWRHHPASASRYRVDRTAAGAGLSRRLSQELQRPDRQLV